MRITESRLRRIIRQVISENRMESIDCVINYKDGRRFDGPCTVKKLMDDIMLGGMDIKNIAIDEMHASASDIESLCMEKGIMCIASVM